MKVLVTVRFSQELYLKRTKSLKNFAYFRISSHNLCITPNFSSFLYNLLSVLTSL